MEEIGYLNKELHKVTNLCDFLIVQPSMLQTLTGIDKEPIMAMNLMRVRCCKLWAENMVKRIEKLCSKKTINDVNELFKMIEVSNEDKKSSPNHQLNKEVFKQ